MDFKGNDAREIINNNSIVDQAAIDLAQSDAPSIIQRVTFDLSTAKTVGNMFKVGFAFKSMYVETATDSATEVEFRPFNASSGNDFFPLTKNGVLNFDKPVKNAFFKWDAQAGKSMTIIFLLNGHFRPGSTIAEGAASVDGNSILMNLR